MKTWKAIVSAVLVSVCLGACSEGDEDVSAGPDLTTAPEATWQDSSGVKRPESTSGHCPNKTGEFAVEHEQTPQCAVIAAMSGQVTRRRSPAFAVQWPDQKVTAQPVQLVWQNTAWRLVLPTQEEAVDAVELPNLDGFTSFGPGE